MRFVWTLPFICFFCGYQLVPTLTKTKTPVQTPNLVGLSLSQAVIALSDCSLNPRIMTQKEDLAVPEGTVVGQTPLAGQSIKEGQPVFLIITKKSSLKTPDLIGKQATEINTVVRAHAIRAKIYHIPSAHPIGNCIGQLPRPGTLLEDKKMILYLSAGDHKLLIFPQLKGKSVHQTQTMLAGYNVVIKLFHTKQGEPNHQCVNCIVVDQNPLAGSLVDSTKQLYVELQVDTEKETV